MSYIQVRPGFYEMYQPDGPWAPGAPGWSRAPVPMWGNNPNLRGPRMLATHGLGQDEGKGAFVVGALLFGLVGLGVFMLSAKEIGKKPARRYARNAGSGKVIAAVWRVKLDNQGYNSRGQYFGLGKPLYQYVAQDSRGKYVATDEIRADNLNHAKGLIRRRLDQYDVRFTR